METTRFDNILDFIKAIAAKVQEILLAIQAFAEKWFADEEGIEETTGVEETTL